MNAKLLLVAVFAILYFKNAVAQTPAQKDTAQPTVLLINAHLKYPGMSEGKLNAAFYNVAKTFFRAKNYRVLETKIEDGYVVADEIEKHLQADIIILQTPVNWENTPWIYKKYVDEVFTSALKTQHFLSGDGRTTADPTKQYGTGGKMQGKKFMIAATWNAPKESFSDINQYLFKGKSADDALFNVAANYLFTGFEVVPGYYCYDVFHNKHIDDDLKNYPFYLQQTFKIN